MLSVIMLSVIMLSVVMPSVVNFNTSTFFPSFTSSAGFAESVPDKLAKIFCVKVRQKGATTFRITTFGMMTLSLIRTYKLHSV